MCYTCPFPLHLPGLSLHPSCQHVPGAACATGMWCGEMPSAQGFHTADYHHHGKNISQTELGRDHGLYLNGSQVKEF